MTIEEGTSNSSPETGHNDYVSLTLEDFVTQLGIRLENVTSVQEIDWLFKQLNFLLFAKVSQFVTEVVDPGESETARMGTKIIQDLSVACIEAAESVSASDANQIIRKKFYGGPCFDAVAALILFQLAPDWLTKLTPDERLMLLEPCFVEAPPVSALLALLPALSSSHVDVDRKLKAQAKSTPKLAEGLLAICLLKKRANMRTGMRQLALSFGTSFETPVKIDKMRDGNSKIGRSDAAYVAGLLASIPDRCSQSAPSVLQSPFFFQLTFAELFKTVEDQSSGGYKSMEDFANNATFLLLGHFISRVSRRGHADIAASQTLNAVLSSHSSPPVTLLCEDPHSLPPSSSPPSPSSSSSSSSSSWHFVASAVRDSHGEERWVEALLREMVRRRLRRTEAVRVLTALFGKLLWTRASTRHLFHHHFLLVKLLPRAALRFLLPFALGQGEAEGEERGRTRGEEEGGGGRGAVVCGVAGQVAQRWGSREFVRSVAQAQQAYVTSALSLILRRLTREELESTPLLLPSLLEGVSVRLESPLPPIRSMARRVAMDFSTLIDPHNPLLLGEGEWGEEEEEEEEEAEEEGGPGAKLGSSGGAGKGGEEGAGNGGVKEEEGGGVVEEEEGMEEEVEGGSEGSLEAYDLQWGGEEEEEEGGEGGDGVPGQLRELLAGLRKQDDPDKVERSLRCAARLVRARPPDLADVASELAQAVLAVPVACVALEGAEAELAAVQSGALLALATTWEAVGPTLETLTSALTSAHLDVGQRLLVLDVMTEAAKELSLSPESGNPDVPEPSGTLREGPWTEVPSPVTLPNGSVTALNWSQSFEKILPLRTSSRRLGKVTKRSGQVGRNGSGKAADPSANRFSLWAPSFMLPVMRRFDFVGPGVDFVGRDFVVLGQLLVMLSTCVRCIEGQHPQVAALGGQLLEMLQAKAISCHQEAYVRKCALQAAAQVMLALPPMAVVVSLSGNGFESIAAGLTWIKEWAESVAENDTDEDCIAIASICLQIHQELAAKAFVAMEEWAPEQNGISLPSSHGKSKKIDYNAVVVIGSKFMSKYIAT